MTYDRNACWFRTPREPETAADIAENFAAHARAQRRAEWVRAAALVLGAALAVVLVAALVGWR